MTSTRQQREEAGRWLREARERRGLRTAGALARLMGVSDSLISRIETGATMATDERAEQIAKALDIDIITVRRNLGLWVPPPSMDETERLLAENERMVAQLRELSERERRAVEALIESLRTSDNPERKGGSVT